MNGESSTSSNQKRKRRICKSQKIDCSSIKPHEKSSKQDIEEYVASFSNSNLAISSRSVNDDESTDSVDEVEIIKELKTSFVSHQCDLCCEGSFLVQKLLEFGGALNNVNKHACEICYKGFAKKSDLTKHQKLHDIEVETLSNSGSSFMSQSSIESKVTCDLCSATCKTNRGLKRHVTQQHNVDYHRHHVCEVCMKTFTNFQQFTQHCLTHSSSSKKLLTCSTCKKEFLWKKNLKDHICKISS